MLRYLRLPHLSARFFALALLWVLALGLPGCTRRSPYLEPVDASTPYSLVLWRTQARDALTADQWVWFDAILQEHKYRVMQQTDTSGSEAIDEAARARIHGRPLADVMREGLQMIIQRRTDERNQKRDALLANIKRRDLIPRENEQMLRDFELHQQELRNRIVRLEQELTQLNAVLAACEAKAKG